MSGVKYLDQVTITYHIIIDNGQVHSIATDCNQLWNTYLIFFCK